MSDQYWIRKCTKELRLWSKDTPKTTFNTCLRFLRRSCLVRFLLYSILGGSIFGSKYPEVDTSSAFQPKGGCHPYNTLCKDIFDRVILYNFSLFSKHPVLNLINRYMEIQSETISHTPQLSSLDASKVISWKAPQLWDATTGSGTQHCQYALVNVFLHRLLKSLKWYFSYKRGSAVMTFSCQQDKQRRVFFYGHYFCF